MEANFDGLVGPTHNYAGLSHGNVASQANRRAPANPKAAALQGLEKMRRVAALGIAQAVIPPLPRPDTDWLRRIGFAGTDAQVVAKAAKADPVLLAACYSASSMWTANAATVTPSSDAEDGRVHVTPANLAGQVHRSLEAPRTAALLRALFPGPRFVHHDPLPAGNQFGDEGAANHTRLAPSHGSPGIHLFVYGRESLAGAGGGMGSQGGKAGSPGTQGPRRFPARQSLEASQAVARLHGLPPARVVFAAQNPAAIDAGVFHNDVIAVGNEAVLFCHESAFRDRAMVLRELRRKYAALKGGPLRVIEVSAREVPLSTAVATYLFNSQLLSPPGGGMRLLAAAECDADARTRKYLAGLSERTGMGIEFADLRQSMRNGGGPACLRLRAAFTEEEWAEVPTGVKFSDALYARLRVWIEGHYRDRLSPGDLADPDLIEESRMAARGIYAILGVPLGSAG
jgi:succinylarginine dihydrolase